MKNRLGFLAVSCSLPTLCISAVFLTLSLGIITVPRLGFPLKTDIRANILSQIWGSNISTIRGDSNLGFREWRSNLGRNSSEQVRGTISNSSLEGLSISPISSHIEENHVVVDPIKRITDKGKDPIKRVTDKGNGFTSDGRDVVRGRDDATHKPAQTSKAEVDVFKNASSHPTDHKQLEPNITSTSNDTYSWITETVSKDEFQQDKATPLPTISTIAPTTGQCDLFKGNWVLDPEVPLYRNDSCPVLSQPQNCQGNGRPDKGYESWRWQPRDCKLPRFDVHAFFRKMQGRTLGFVGDSVARNQMESLMCILWQVETPINRGNRKMQRWFFRSHSVTIIRIWSAWLVHTSTEAFKFAPENLTKLHLEEPDESFMEFLPKFDVLVLSAGHWLTKKTAYISKGELVGGQLWWNNRYPKKLNSSDAFVITMHTALKAIVSYPNYKGITIFRTYSPDHYEGGAWNTGGSCTGKTQPATDAEVVFNPYTQLIRRHQLEAFAEVEKNVTNASKLRLMDITPVFDYRADGHPGPYRNLDPHKITKRGPRGQPPPQDCLHWCMPGPIDSWNEFLFEILKQEL